MLLINILVLLVKDASAESLVPGLNWNPHGCCGDSAQWPHLCISMVPDVYWGFFLSLFLVCPSMCVQQDSLY